MFMLKCMNILRSTKGFLSVILILMSCSTEKVTNEMLNMMEIQIPDQNEGAQGNLYASSSGEVFFTWISYENDTVESLKIGRIEGDSLVDVQTISSGSDWFVNWADFPALSSFDDTGKHLLTHWLAKRTERTYDYDINLSIGDNNAWSDPFILHDDNVAAEHGFVSYLPVGNDMVMCSWLDGRNTKDEKGNHQ